MVSPLISLQRLENTMKFKRARSSEQIENRKQEIMECALAIFEEQGYHEVNFSNIAKRTKFTRPTIYTYFKTKEEILLCLILHYAKFATSLLEKELDKNNNLTLDEISEIFAEIFMQVPQYIELYSVLYTFITPHTSLDALSKFRAEFLSYEVPFANVLRKAYPNIPDKDVRIFLLMYHSVACGYYPIATSKQMQAAEKMINVNNQHDYKKLLHTFLYNYFYCLQNQLEKSL